MLHRAIAGEPVSAGESTVQHFKLIAVQFSSWLICCSARCLILRPLYKRLIMRYCAAVIGGSVAYGFAKMQHMVFAKVAFDWLNETLSRNSGSAYLNSAIPATPSAYMAMCLKHHLPPNVELVMVRILGLGSKGLKSSCHVLRGSLLHGTTQVFSVIPTEKTTQRPVSQHQLSKL